MAVDKLLPNDSRITHHNINLNGKTYHYILGQPSSTPKATIFLIHGFPDLSFGWRYQVPFLMSMGLCVVVPDMLGYGGSDAPSSPEFMTFKRAADDMSALAAHLSVPQIILGGHDWGGLVVYRIAQWYPQLISAVFSVCTPYIPPSPVYLPTELVVQHLPNFKYQLQFAGTEVEEKIVGKEKLKQLFNGMYGGTGPNREHVFDTDHGILFDNLSKVGPSPNVSAEEIEFYAEQFNRNGFHGPCNWYRTREYNFKDEEELVKRGGEGVLKVSQPTMFIVATRDAALPESMSEGMEQYFEAGLVRRRVDATHWALTEAAEEVNGYVKEFLEGVLGGKGESKI